jgi:hypothetical protein
VLGDAALAASLPNSSGKCFCRSLRAFDATMFW